MAGFILFPFPGLQAQTPDPKFEDYLASVRELLPADGTLLYDCSMLAGYQYFIQGENTISLIDIEEDETPFSQAYRADISEVGNWWDTQLITPPNTSAVQQGDMLFWVFYARAMDVMDDNQLAKTSFKAQLAEYPWPAIVQYDVYPQTDWIRYYVYGEAPQDYEPGQLEATFFLEYLQQTIDLGGFIALNLGQDIDPDDLPLNFEAAVFQDYLASVRELLPVDGTLLYDCSVLTGYQFGTQGVNSFTLFNVEDDEIPFSQAWRANVTEVSEYWWSTGIITPSNATAIVEGDMLFWVFYARTNEVDTLIGLAKGSFAVHITEPPFTNIVQSHAYPQTKWTRFYVYTEAPADYEPGDLQGTMHFEFFPQIIEIGGFIALNLGQGVDPASLPANVAMIDSQFDDYLASVRELLPNDGTLLFDCASLSGYNYYGKLPYNTFSMVNTENDDVPFGKAYRVNTSSFTPGIYEQVILPKNEVPVQWGDMVFMVFYARSVTPQQETGMAMHAGCGTSSYTSREISSLTLGPPGYEWTPYYFFGKAHQVYDIGDIMTFFFFSHSPQTIDIGGFIALNLGQGIDPQDLPYTVTTYPGREEDAPWRAQAAERIEEHRKGDLLVQVVDEAGEPVMDAEVSVEMKRHAFKFGTHPAWMFNYWEGPNGAIYREKLLSLFNAATTPFFMGTDEWGWYAQPESRATNIAMAQWLQQHNISISGTTLIYPGWSMMPSFFFDLADDPEALHTALIHHLDTIVPIGRDAGVDMWDVINEQSITHEVMDILGDEVIIDWFEHTHFLHPEAQLSINDFNILMGGGYAGQHANLKYLINILQNANAPIHRIGFQSHFNNYLPSIEVIFEILEDFSVYDLNIHISEFDINIYDEEAQADYTRDFMTIMFSHPSVDRFTKWGFWEATMYIPNAAMFRTDWTEKPNYFAYTDLVFNQWWTEEEGLSNELGEFFVRGFLGEYEITVHKEGISSTQEAVLVHEGTTVTLVLPDPTFIITVTAGDHGQIEPAGEIIVEQGSDQSFLITPDEGYHVDKILVDSEEIDPDTDENWDAENHIYSFYNVIQDHTIEVSFKINTYLLSYLAEENGSISGEVTQIVEHGADGTPVEAIPDEGYHFTGWSDGLAENPRTDTNVAADLEVEAEFLINMCTITFIIENEHGETIPDAVVTLDQTENPPGDYVFEDVEPGDYSYTVTAENYFDASGEVEVIDQDIAVTVVMEVDDTGIAEAQTTEITIFPNPVRNTLHIESNIIISQIQLLDMLGQRVMSGTVNDIHHELNVSGLKDGLYFIQVFTNRGVKTLRINVVK